MAPHRNTQRPRPYHASKIYPSHVMVTDSDAYRHRSVLLGSNRLDSLDSNLVLSSSEWTLEIYSTLFQHSPWIHAVLLA